MGVRDEGGGVDREVRCSGREDEHDNGASVTQSPCTQCVGEDEPFGNVHEGVRVEKMVVCEQHGTLPPEEGGNRPRLQTVACVGKKPQEHMC